MCHDARMTSVALSLCIHIVLISMALGIHATNAYAVILSFYMLIDKRIISIYYSSMSHNTCILK